MAGKSPSIKVSISGEADMDKARRDIGKDLDKIGRDADSTADDIAKAFRQISPELDTSDIRKAIDLADQLDKMVVDFDIDTDLSEIQEAEKLAKSLRAFQGRVDLSVEGRAELTDVLGLAEKMDQVRSVKVQVQGRQDLEKAEQIVRDLDGSKVDIDVQVDDSALDNFAESGQEAAGSFLEGFDAKDLGGSLMGQLTGALSVGAPAIGGLAAVWGDEIMEGLTRGLNQRKDSLLTQLQTNFSASDLAPIGDAAGEAYADGFGDGLRELTVDAATLETALRQVDGAMDLEQTLRAASTLDEYLGVSIPESSVLAARMVRQGLAKDTVEAFDIMTYAAAQYGETGIESLELTREFGGVIGRLGIDGAAAIDFINQAYMTGLLPTIDRGAELFEEFNIIMSEGPEAAREAVEMLGLDWDQMQSQIIQGGPAARDAMDQIVTALAGVTNETQQSDIALALFGMTIESATDKPEVIEALRKLMSAQLDVAGASEEAAAKVEAMQTPVDKAGKTIENLAYQMALVASLKLNEVTAGWSTLGEVVQWVGRDLGLIEEPTTRLATALTKGGGGGRDFADGAAAAAEAAGEMRLEFDDAADATKWLEVALGGLFDFTADQLFREVTEQGQALVETFAEAGSGAVDMAGNIDISTDAGRRLEAALEGMSGMAVDASVALAEGRIEAGEYRDILNIAESAIRSAGEAAGLTAAQVDELTARYMDQAAIDAVVTRLVATDEATRPVRDVDAAYRALPDRVNADLVATDKGTVPTRNLKSEIAGLSGKTVTLGTNVGAAISSVKTLQQAINSLQGKTVTASVRQSVGFSTRAEGGPVRAGQPYIVGEEGQELYVPDQNGTIIDADRTRSLLATSAAAQSFIGSGASGAGGGGRTVLELRSSGSAVDDFLVEMMRRAVANRGGVDVVFGRS